MRKTTLIVLAVTLSIISSGCNSEPSTPEVIDPVSRNSPSITTPEPDPQKEKQEKTTEVINQEAIALNRAFEKGDRYTGDLVKTVKQHITAGTDLNAKVGQYGLTPLHYLAGESLRDLERTKTLIELLITNGANVNALANATNAYKQRTPLDIAQKKVEMGLPPVYVELLRKHGGKTAKVLKTEAEATNK